MDGLSTKTDENGFDDNGLQHAFMLASLQEIPSSECIDERYTDGTELSHCDPTPTGREEVKSTDIGDGEKKLFGAAHFEDENVAISLGVHPKIVGVIGDEENKQLLISKDQNNAKKGPDLTDYLDFVCPTTRNDGAEVADGRSTKRSKKAKANKEKLRVHPKIMGGIGDDESTQLLKPKDQNEAKKGTDQKYDSDLPVEHTIRKEEAENFDGRSTENPRNVEARKAKFRSGRSEKDGGCFKRITDRGILSLLASIWAIFCSKISWKFSVSLTVGILLLMPSVGVDSATTAVPANTLFVVGTTVRMNCSTDLNQPVYWARTLAGSDEQQWIYYGNDGFHSNNADGRFSIDKDEAMGRYDIVIADVQPKDAGRYVCIDDSGLGASESAELVVSEPIKCNSYIPSDGVMGYNVFGLKQDFIQVSCSLTYAGNLSPTLEWSWPGSDVQNDERDVYAAKSLVVSTLKLSPSKEHNGLKFQCNANIEGPTLQTSDSRLLWVSETVTVKYAEFAREEVDACPGVELNLICNPQCSYTFERGKGDTCRCLYTYHDQRTQQNYQSASYAVNCGNKNNSLSAVLISLAVATATLVSAVAVACYLKKKKPKWFTGNAKSNQTSDNNESSKAMIALIELANK